jgi:hypothetical protein
MNLMRNNLYILLLLLFPTFLSCSRNELVVRGRVNGAEGKGIELRRLDINRFTDIDSFSTGRDGSFSFTTELEYPELFVLSYASGEIINLLLAPGDRVTVTTTDTSFGEGYIIEGSAESENIRMLVERMNTTRAILDSLRAVAETIRDPSSPHMGLVKSAYAQTLISQKRFTIRYLVDHMNSLSSVYALYQKYNEGHPVLDQESDLQYFKTVADSLELSHPNSSLTKSLRADIRQREANQQEQYQMNRLLEMAEGASGIVELSIPDRDGNKISLSSLKGKVVLLIFWASGNEESISVLLRLRSTYEHYHAKGFEVYAISLDNNRIRWMNAVDFNEFSWINVSELNYPDSKANMLYNVTVLPSDFLISREGDIVAKNLFGITLETWLDNLL